MKGREAGEAKRKAAATFPGWKHSHKPSLMTNIQIFQLSQKVHEDWRVSSHSQVLRDFGIILLGLIKLAHVSHVLFYTMLALKTKLSFSHKALPLLTIYILT